MRCNFPLFLALIQICVQLSGQSAPGLSWNVQPGEVDWDEEFALLAEELCTRHPDLFFYGDSAEFYRSMAGVAAASGERSVFDVAVMLQQVLAGLGDNHTLVNYHYLIKSRYILPVECYWFEDGIYVTGARKEYERLLGEKIIGINHYPLTRVIDSLSTLIPGGNQSRLMDLAGRMITWTQLLNHFGFADTTGLELVYEAGPGDTLNQLITLPSGESEFVRADPEVLPMGWQDRKTYFRAIYLKDDRILYVQYNKCWSREAEEKYGTGASALFMPSFREFEKNVLDTIREQEIRKLVLDLRFNDGGSDVQGTRFIRKLEHTGIGDRAGIYLVTGRKTASEALVNAYDLIDTFRVTVVGEESGGRPNHFGCVERFVLPGSGLVINCPTNYISVTEGDPPALIPGIRAPLTYADFSTGVDPALEVIRRHPGR
jgi:hypothetical protein